MKKISSIVISVALIAALFAQNTLAAADIQEAYKRVLNRCIADWGAEYVNYTLFDLDNNGTKELIVDLGGSDGSTAYGYENGVTKDYGDCTGNVYCFYQKNNNLYTLCTECQYSGTYYWTFEVWIERITLNNGKILKKTMYRNPSYNVSVNELNKDLKINIPEVTEFFKGAKKISFANIADTSLLKSLSPVKVILNGRKLSFAQQPIIENGRVMVPLRTVFEALGYDVVWNGKTKTAEASNGNNVIAVKINSKEITYNKGTYKCDTAPKIISGKTLVPIRAISECAGCRVNWDDKTKTVYIISQ